MTIEFMPKAFQDFCEWMRSDKKVGTKIEQLIKEVERIPYQGTGKPEALKHELSGYWSRRITQEHRLVYKIENDVIIVISCKHHY
ncbi:MAG: Txe/YoeB family addiction module toxin [Spirochaetaceae bacterium]|jgi:toxin YoeB|nr:Txe/YoeB family addiction module toxin [Spirochaetaceae bacterium]